MQNTTETHCTTFTYMHIITYYDLSGSQSCWDHSDCLKLECSEFKHVPKCNKDNIFGTCKCEPLP